jgi:hypothetical protein
MLQRSESETTDGGQKIEQGKTHENTKMTQQNIGKH